MFNAELHLSFRAITLHAFGDEDRGDPAEPIVLELGNADLDDSDDEVELHPNGPPNDYVALLKRNSGLLLLQENRIRGAYSRSGEAGLFALFVTGNFKNSLREWANAVLRNDGIRDISESGLDAYIGLELAISITSINEISDFWSSKRFLGSSDFADTMARNRFQQIRSHLKVHPAGGY
ncbi:hypothetical protein V7S43_002872 [Phytophthora oleae]|uniref:PiggyBac transposable element-derived protein domain-containing protein n=1 Tax=Phytophthora oleae TaxID=2107226 RepID=A0ABD3FZ70_9STRA